MSGLSDLAPAVDASQRGSLAEAFAGLITEARSAGLAVTLVADPKRASRHYLALGDAVIEFPAVAA